MTLAAIAGALAVYAVPALGTRTSIRLDSSARPRLLAIVLLASAGAIVGARRMRREARQ